MKTTLLIKGTHCHACKMLIEEVCSEITGIQSCTVDFKTGQTIIEHHPSVDLKKVKQEIETLGKYEVRF